MKPNEFQIKNMEMVIESYLNKNIATIPSIEIKGKRMTGKTMCLLSIAYGFMQAKINNLLQIGDIVIVSYKCDAVKNLGYLIRYFMSKKNEECFKLLNDNDLTLILQSPSLFKKKYDNNIILIDDSVYCPKIISNLKYRDSYIKRVPFVISFCTHKKKS